MDRLNERTFCRQCRSATRGFSSSILRSLRHRNFRLFFGGQFLSLFGTWMTTIATRWLIFELMLGQDWILGLITFAGQIPILLPRWPALGSKGQAGIVRSWLRNHFP